MKKLFVTADVHSYYQEMMNALVEAEFDMDNKDHIFVSCGDLLDRGPQPQECLDFVNKLPDDRKILIRGNHEVLLTEALNRGMFFQHDYHNRTIDTVARITGFSIDDMLDHPFTCTAAMTAMDTNESIKKYYSQLRPYAEVGQYVFVHGWIPEYFKGKDPFSDGHPMNATDRLNGEWRIGDWDDAVWANGMKQWSKGIRLVDKCIVCGHYHTSWGHTHLHHVGFEWDEIFYEAEPSNEYAHFEPFIDDGIIALDSCCAYSGFLNVVVLEVEDEEWQSSM